MSRRPGRAEGPGRVRQIISPARRRFPGHLAAPALATATALLIHILAALRLDGRPPTDGEARFAAAVFAVRGGPIGTVGLSLSDQLAARQVAAVAALVAPSASVWDTVRVVGLVLGVLTAVLLWAVLHRLGCGGPSIAVAVVVVGVTPAALALHTSATAASVAVPWLLTAAVLCWRGRVLGLVAAVAALLAAVTAPLVGAALLALAALWVADRTVSGTVRASRGVPMAALLGGAAAGLAVAAAGAGPLAGQVAPMITTRAASVGAVCGLAAVSAAWRVRWVRPLLGPALLVLAVLLVPGPGRAAAALTAFALLGMVAAAVVDDLAVRVPARARPVLGTVAMVAAAVAAVLAGAALPVLRPATAVADPPPAALMAWAGEQVSSGAVLHADPLDRAELVAAGFPPERLRDLGGPVADVDVLLLADRPHVGQPVDTPVHCAAGTLLATVPSWAGAPAQICAARPPVADPDPAERSSRVRIGTALTRNPGLQLAPAAAQLLRDGAVDPRIMVVLAALTGIHTLTVADFPLPALQPSGAVRQQVLVTAVDGAPVGGDAPSALREWLGGQHPPFAPTVLRDDGPGLVVGYRDAPPAGLLPSS